MLSDQDKRNTYDAVGHSNYTSGATGAHGTGFTARQAEEVFRSFFSGGGGGFENIFEKFGGGGGVDFGSGTHKIGLSLSFMEAVRGCTKDISLRVQGPCERCFGSGGEPGTKEQVCPYCRGRGEVRFTVLSLQYFSPNLIISRLNNRTIIGCPCVKVLNVLSLW